MADLLRDVEVDAIFSSDLRRARQTAEVLHRSTKAPVTATRELRPWDVGVFAGHRVKDVLPFLLNLLNQHPDVPVPGGESFYQFFGRYSSRLHAMLAFAEESSNSVVAVTHVRNLLAAATIIQSGDRDRVPVRGGPSTGSVTIVEKENGRWTLYPLEKKQLPLLVSDEAGVGILQPASVQTEDGT
jgi:probable phosphoglycerate mutase